MGNYIGKIRFFSVLGAVNPTPEPIKAKFGTDERTYGPLLHAKFLPWSMQRVAPAGRKTQKSARE